MKYKVIIVFILLVLRVQAKEYEISDITYNPDSITVKDSITINYDYWFSSSDCYIDSTEILMPTKNVIKVTEYYEVEGLFVPCQTKSSIELGMLPPGTYILKLYFKVIEQPVYNDSGTISFIVHPISSFQNNQLSSDYNIYPNPVIDNLTICTLTPLSTLVIYNTLGKKVLRQVATGKDETLDVSNLPKGLYVITIKTREGKVVTQRFVKE